MPITPGYALLVCTHNARIASVYFVLAPILSRRLTWVPLVSNLPTSSWGMYPAFSRRSLRQVPSGRCVAGMTVSPFSFTTAPIGTGLAMVGGCAVVRRLPSVCFRFLNLRVDEGVLFLQKAFLKRDTLKNGFNDCALSAVHASPSGDHEAHQRCNRCCYSRFRRGSWWPGFRATKVRVLVANSLCCCGNRPH